MTDLALELQSLGHSVTVLTTTPHYNLEKNALARQPMQRRWGGMFYYSELEGIPVWHVKVPVKGQKIWSRLVDFIRFHIVSLAVSFRKLGQQDIVIATSPPLTIGVISWLLGVRWRAPSVYKVAELHPDSIIRQGMVHNPALVKLMRGLERFVYCRNSMIVPIAEDFKQVIQRHGIPDGKICVIPDFVDTELYQPLTRVNRFAETHNLLNDFVVLYGGNIGLAQDWDSVIFAAEILSELPIQFVIVGDGVRRLWLEDEVRERGLKNIKLLGYQPKELMPQINASCDIDMIPMNRTGALDGLPSKIYTIMACGKPVIASAETESELARIIKQSGCGRVVPPQDRQAYVDAILKAFRERESLPIEGQRGRIFVEKNYSKEAIARKYDVLIRQLTNQRIKTVHLIAR
jgi:glycosyltransferase involved in cell wall biosynthesis